MYVSLIRLSCYPRQSHLCVIEDDVQCWHVNVVTSQAPSTFRRDNNRILYMCVWNSPMLIGWLTDSRNSYSRTFRDTYILYNQLKRLMGHGSCVAWHGSCLNDWCNFIICICNIIISYSGSTQSHRTWQLWDNYHAIRMRVWPHIRLAYRLRMLFAVRHGPTTYFVLVSFGARSLKCRLDHHAPIHGDITMITIMIIRLVVQNMPTNGYVVRVLIWPNVECLTRTRGREHDNRRHTTQQNTLGQRQRVATVSKRFAQPAAIRVL